MRLIRHFEKIDDPCRGSVAALGNFDGFHRGHHVIIGEAGRLARAMSAGLTVVTTEPHPRAYFDPHAQSFRLTPFRERTRLLSDFGVDVLAVLPFDRSLASMSAQDFVLQVLLAGLGVMHVVVGYDYRFGQGRGGGVDVLAWMGEMERFGVSVIDPVRFGIEGAAGETYSSTLVRQTLREGKARRAAALLGHWWSVSGRVLEGEKRGRTIGFPTANLALEESLVPALGVYAVRVVVDEDPGTVQEGVANIGRRPTFKDGPNEVLLEAHLFDYAGDLYGKHLRVEMVGFIRPEKKFSGLDALRQQIQLDAVIARALLDDPENERDRLLPPTLDSYLSAHPAASQTISTRHYGAAT